MLLKKRELEIGFVFSDYNNELGVETRKKTEINRIDQNDFVFITTSDQKVIDAIKEVGAYSENIIITSGGIHMRELPQFVSVFYPLYSFSIYSDIDWSKVPVFLEYNNVVSISFKKLLEKLQLRWTFLNSDDRNKVHLAAVFVNNFTNANLIAAKEVLTHFRINKFEYLIPILMQTADKVLTNDPKDSQTGPAIRGDEDVIKHHIELLKSLDEEKDLYILLSKYIRQKFKK
ncbi:MAG: DUF2520 domain-containing protein [Bacteroidia bacterium]